MRDNFISKRLNIFTFWRSFASFKQNKNVTTHLLKTRNINLLKNPHGASVSFQSGCTNTRSDITAVIVAFRHCFAKAPKITRTFWVQIPPPSPINFDFIETIKQNQLFNMWKQLQQSKSPHIALISKSLFPPPPPFPYTLFVEN